MAKGKYSYNRNYYENMARNTSFDGNAARQLNVVPEEDYEIDEDIEELDYAEYETEAYTEEPVVEEPRRRRRYEQDTDRRADSEPRTRYRIKIDLTQVMVFAAAVSMLVFAAFRFIEVQSDINQTAKQLKAAQVRLDDVNALNASLASALDTEIDRNYIYSVAVGRLGMVYPNENQIVTYTPADTGYVHQMSFIPGN